MAAAFREPRSSPVAAPRSAYPGAPSRLTLAFAAALLLHLTIALMLPDVRRRLRSAPPPPASASPAAAAMPAAGEVIPIRLPLAGFHLQTELGAIARDSPATTPLLPAAAKAASGKLGISNRLGEAARQEAAATSDRQRPRAPVAEAPRRIGDLRLAASPVPAPAEDPSGRSAGTRVDRAAPRETAQANRAAVPVRKPAATASPVPAPTPAPGPAPPKPATRAPPLVQQPIRPPVFAPATPYRATAPEQIAIAPPLPPLNPGDSSSPPPTGGDALGLGAQAAPDRGPGAAVAGRGAFFQQLTTHLFMTNQQVLAEAIRATPRLTVEVRFTIDRSGRVLGAQVMRSTGEPALDRKAADVILRASPVPQMAADMPQPRLELSFPVQIYR